MGNLRRYQRTTRGIFCAGTFMLGPAVTSSCSTYRIERAKHRDYKEWVKYQWNKEEELDEKTFSWTSYSRKVEGSKYKEFKIVGEIETTPERAVQAVREKEKNNKNRKGTWKFEPLENGNTKAVYTVHADSGESLSVRAAHSKIEKALPMKFEHIKKFAENVKQEVR